jgi:hypothetical protein
MWLLEQKAILTKDNMWLLEQKAILTKDNILKRKWQGVPDYYFCGPP